MDNGHIEASTAGQFAANQPQSFMPMADIFILTAQVGLLYLRENLVSTNDSPSTSSMLFRLFPSGGEKTNAPHFARTGWRHSKACMQKFLSKVINNISCLCSTLSVVLLKKLDHTLQLSNLKKNVSYVDLCLCTSLMYDVCYRTYGGDCRVQLFI